MKLLAISALVFLLMLAFPASAGCCVGTSSCTASAGPPCTTGTFSDQDCSAISQCGVGCCCSSGETRGLITREVACQSPSSFFARSAGIINDVCSCGSSYSIEGSITANGVFVGGALVSVDAISTRTTSAGTYKLENVPAGSVTVRASMMPGCFGASTFTLSADRTGANIPLTCSCTPGTCNPGAYCGADRTWIVFNLTSASSLSTYCGLCSDSVLCPSNQCIGGDGACNPGCTANEDSDCACSMTKNNICPGSCNPSNDADCTSTVRGCGDGIVAYPFETCEQNPRSDQLSMCSGSACASCNCVTNFNCGNQKIDPGESCELGMVCSNGAACGNCQCNQACVGASKNPTLTLSYVAASRQMNARWSTPDVCRTGIGSYAVFICSGGACTDPNDFSLQGTYPGSQTNASMNLQTSTDYSFFVRAFYLDSTTGQSEIKKMSSGNAFCLDLQDTSAQFCWGNERSRCDTNFNIVKIENCDTGSRHCMGPDRSGNTVCESVGACELCNGLYGVFSYLDFLQVPQASVRKYCWPGPGRDVVTGCFQDESKTVVKAFDYCGEITSCYDYKSESACEDTADPCGKNQGCQWDKLDDSKPEMGGVCKPTSTSLQNCGFCDNPEYNSLSPSCTPEVCSLFGECYYQGAGAPVSCSNRQVSSCMTYRSQTECEGGRPVTVNAQYNSSNARTGGTHTVTASLDILGLGKCYWDAINNRCMRDADGLKANFTRNTGIDCNDNDAFCESDFDSPVTTIMPSAFGLYPANARIRFVVSDDYPAKSVTSYFCLSTGTCYPKESAQSEYQAQVTSSGRYNLYYYSTDPAKNLEVVRSIALDFDADLPVIDLIKPATANDFQTNQQNLPITLKVPSDTRFVCANNTLTRQAQCVNSCTLAPTGCIPSSGIFNMTVALGSSTSLNATRNIILHAEDFAGNRYQNTMLGILLDIEPPNAPVISID